MIFVFLISSFFSYSIEGVLSMASNMLTILNTPIPMEEHCMAIIIFGTKKHKHTIDTIVHSLCFNFKLESMCPPHSFMEFKPIFCM